MKARPTVSTKSSASRKEIPTIENVFSTETDFMYPISNFNKYNISMKELDYFLTPSDLFKYIEGNEEKLAIRCLENSPEQASTWVSRKSEEDGSVLWRRLPIHEACIRDPSLALIDALIEADPSTLKAVDAAGRLPLHHACIHGASEAVVEKMVKVNPESMSSKDVWGKTPLSAVETSTNINKAAVIDLLSKGPSYFLKKVIEDEVLSDMILEKERVDKELQEMKKKYSSKAASMNSSAVEQYHKLEEQNKFQRKELEILEKERNELSEQLRACSSVFSTLKKEVEVASSIHAESLSDLKRKIKEGEIQAEKDAQEIARLKNEVDRDRSSSLIDTMTQRLTRLTKENKTMETKNLNMQEQLKEVDGLKDIFSRFDTSLLLLDSNHQKLIAEVETQKKELINMVERCEQTLRSAKYSHSTIDAIRKDISDIIVKISMGDFKSN